MLPRTSALIIFSLLLMHPSGALPADKELVRSFNQAYKAYLEFDQQGLTKKSLPEAKTALDLGEKILDEDGVELAILTYNYGNNLLQLKKYAVAQPALRKALGRYEVFYGKDAPELVQMLMDLGRVEVSLDHSNSAIKHYKRALKQSEKHDGKNSVEFGWRLTEVGSTIINRSYSQRAGKYLYRGHTILRKNLGDEYARTGYAAFHLAKYEMQNDRLPKARDLLLLALKSFENPNQPSNQLELSTHAFLVKIFEKLGHSQQATEHCLAIGRMTPMEPGQDFQPLFTTVPEYPMSALYKGHSGSVKLGYIIDENGFVKDPIIVEVSGNPVFGPASIDALSQWRFAPRFENGRPVATKTTQVMTFELK